MRPSTIFTAASLTALAAARAVDLERRDATLQVKLSQVSNTLLKAVVKNTGSVDLNLFNKGSLLDAGAVEKVTVTAHDSNVPFEGIRYRMATQNLSPDHFTEIKAGQQLEVLFDTGAVHDLSSGGTYKFLASGAIPFAEAGSTELSQNAVAFQSNTLELEVDGAKAALIPRFPRLDKLDKRTRLNPDGACTSSQLSATRTALSQCQRLASQAATAATSGSASKFSEYFKTSSRSTVASNFNKVAAECSSTNSGSTNYYCDDVLQACESNVLAYTQPSSNVVVNCPLYFSALVSVTGTCHAQDQATTTLHEFTHASGVLGSISTNDYAYGYSASIRLSAAQAARNADTYALYANAIDVGC